jgi:hypothetical protein
MLLFIVVALILYALFSRPHRRVPGRPIQVGTPTGSRMPQPGSARAAAVASEPVAQETGGATLSGSVSPADTGEPETTAHEPDDGAPDDGAPDDGAPHDSTGASE